jgi:hypothetical protein
MIDYALMCQAISDWRSGRRPSLPPSSTPTLPAARPEGLSMEEVDSDMLEVDEYGAESAVPEGYESPDHTPIAPIEVDTTIAYGDADDDDSRS